MDVGMSVQVVHKFCLFRKHLSVSRNRSFSHTGTKKIQLFRDRLSEKVHATILKGIVGGFECTVLQRNLKEWYGMFAMLCLGLLKESNNSRFDSYSR